METYINNGTCRECTRALECLSENHAVRRHKDNQSVTCPVVQWEPVGACATCSEPIVTTAGAFPWDGKIIRHSDKSLDSDHVPYRVSLCPAGHRLTTKQLAYGDETTCDAGEYRDYYSIGD